MLHVTSLRITHKNYDSFVLAVMSRIHGRLNRASWADATCDELKDKLEKIYTRLRWLLLNVGQDVSANPNSSAREDMQRMLEGDPDINDRVAIITFEGNYYLTDRR